MEVPTRRVLKWKRVLIPKLFIEADVGDKRKGPQEASLPSRKKTASGKSSDERTEEELAEEAERLCNILVEF